MIYSKNKFQISTNRLNILCSILSLHGITSKLAHFLKGLRSWTVIKVKRKKLAEDHNFLARYLGLLLLVYIFRKLAKC